jgi:putative ABC transport system ATP-binding protein
MSYAVETRNIIKDFPSGDETVRVLHGISVNIPFGELSMLVGPSGCGKTTLLSIVSGILTPTSGQAIVCGEDVTALSDREKVRFRRRELGFIFQQFNLLPSLSAVENAAVVLMASGIPAQEAEARAADILRRIGMGDHLHKLPAHLSGGQQQRVAIARALSHDPRVLICDEPTASLDAHTGQLVMQILRDIALDPKRAVIVVTHDNRIFSYADRIFTMEDGLIEKEEKIERKQSA